MVMIALMKRIVLTGCTRGLGLEMWRGFVERGHQVAGCGRSAFPDPVPDGCRYDHVDVADDDAVAAWATAVLAEGPPDLVVNNAAIINEPRPIWEIPREDFDRLVDINIRGPVHVIRHFAPAMIEAGRGVVVNFSSGWGRSTAAEVTPYCMSKWAMEALSSAMAQELPDGLAAIALNPGIIHTDMLQTVWGDGAAGFENAAQWAERAVDKILSFGPHDSGRPASV